MAKLALFVCAILAVATHLVHGAAEIEPSLSPRFLGTGKTENVMVSFTQGIEPVIQQNDRQNFSSSAEKRTALTNAQEAFSMNMQAPLAAVLNANAVPFETFWINNRMYVPNADSGLIQMMSTVPAVARIEKERVYDIGSPVFHEVSKRQTNLAWGVRKIRANEVWPNYGGKNIVVANIDTGVRYTHESLRSRWRSSYGWYDPYEGGRSPIDRNGHGTHTMGTIAGSNGIGVAPEATWIACRGCDARTCGGSQLYKCGQWIQCPTRYDGSARDCSKAPKIVSNSWGGGQGDTGYDSIVRSWKSSKIIPVFSIGNAGQNGCGSANSPGDRPEVIGVGSTDSNDRISYFSSLGPTVEGKLKPDISAPGGQIKSASYSSDTGYVSMSGTSMACPHVSGVIALMYQKNPSLTYTNVYDAITQSATTSLDTTSAESCGGVSPSSYPNHVFGYGRIDAVDSVNAV